jgi:hypothetical protein
MRFALNLRRSFRLPISGAVETQRPTPQTFTSIWRHAPTSHAKQPAGLVQRLLPLKTWDRVRHDAGTYVKSDAVAGLHCRANGDIKLAALVKSKVADSPGVKSSGTGF